MIPHALTRTEPWYGAAPSSVADPHHVPSTTARNRFNEGAGTFALRYLAADPVTALLEVVALHGSYPSGFTPGPPLAHSWTIFRYRITKPLTVVNFTFPSVRIEADTTIQELTGDWLGYHHSSLLGHALPANPPRVVSRHPVAPTQRLANDIFNSTKTHGFLAPSAKSPTIANLVLFHPRMPVGSVLHTGTARIVI